MAGALLWGGGQAHVGRGSTVEPLCWLCRVGEDRCGGRALAEMDVDSPKTASLLPESTACSKGI
jgi:hypothetical protein